MNIIALTGRVGSGKTTIAKQIAAIVPNSVVVSFAGPVKEIAKQVFGWDGQKDERGRRLLQVIGTEAGRAYNCDIWVDLMRTKLGHLFAAQVPLILIDDLRFENEADMVRVRGGFIIKLQGRGGLAGELGEHASEQGFPMHPDSDFTVDNTPTPLETAHTVMHSVGLRHLMINPDHFREEKAVL